MNTLKSELLDIIENEKLSSRFQPIISLASQTIFSFEALIRGPSASPLHNPFNLFAAAEQCDLSVQLEHACRHTSIREYAALNLPHKLFLNVSPHVLLHPDFKSGKTLRFLEEMGIAPESVVIEITEQQAIEDYGLMRSAVEHYRGMGFQIALDDLGAGYSSLRVWTELMPDFVKIDRHFIQDIDKDKVKLDFVRSIQAMAIASNCQVIAEGIETEAEFLVIDELGIAFAQGYYFARPETKPKTHIEKKLFKSSFRMNKIQAKDVSLQVVSIQKQYLTISPDMLVFDVLGLYRKQEARQFLPMVTKAGVCCGIVSKEQFLTKLFASQYGLDLYGKKEISQFMTQRVLSFEANSPLEDVSKQLTAHYQLMPAFAITDNGQYKGVGTLMDLLAEITKQQIKSAKYTNPLTLLPGAPPINEKMSLLLSQGNPFSVAFFDLDHFKPFNDEYGYAKGDEVIKIVAKLLNKWTTKQIDLLGHIGGDDFIVIFTDPNWQAICHCILKDFETEALELYSEEHQNNKGISGYDRQGNACFFPILSLSIGAVPPNAIASCVNYMEISDLAAQAKHQAKLIKGNSCFVNQRIVPVNKQTGRAA
ncbi:MAG: EAL and GGDEF domain-containing protein [Methyloprofundus sp.]|nr:EAL and GGDEF domain-containing protein [Methyloprofundus sp.]